MNTRLLKWGNSLAVRVPKAYVDEMKIGENSILEMTLYEGALILMPKPESRWDLQGLLAGVTDANNPGEGETEI